MRILITGATSGIGKELALNYAQAGHDVIACGRSQEKLNVLNQQHPNIQPLCFDLTDYDNYPSDQGVWGALDLLIFNAGDCEYIDDPLNFDAKKFERIININLISIGYGLQTWLKSLQSGGRLVLVSSSAGLLPLPRAEAYGSSKAAVTYLGKTLSAHLAQHDINVTVVHPGFVKTPLTDKNTFPMPMIVSTQEAAHKIIDGIEKGKADISFPTLFIFMMKCLRFLPSSLWNRIATKMG
ncbi:SDR family NAD(P)-dependent oxidoreductase [Vibrio genomosp. F10]|uniref:Short-chain dehydrogenase n=1 Tax=Vibrio genomosp. F10 str. ZF-129 TaxID=1187848 RepID=A0A1E5BA54_9VIBR|nr:SDR family NAD(P)-dependent oxidoreductase [Vibrio genomosp. F10]OEE30773.1 short-chain dehydrogenase [Vibrio genomosp. F10 str. ZF-129]OEE92720.1 short-chain dehydrogenase [Vibrio genomosp. F10 str. 9ZC157]OEF01287.1 short-chain dehydrogenase [Vibrio genomosp. F10 str. 9ZD137]OEF05416.1 short-chain dehydrogenase [Vibrio genomosp. F10 str. 9ZB36]